jgi:hypothetical protein
MRRLHATVLSLVCLVAVIIALVITEVGVPSWSFGGGLVGAFSSLIVMGDYLFSSGGKESSSTLLFFRAFCDLGVASRFIFYQSINKQVCNHRNCYVDDKKYQDNCGLSAGYLEFFEMASEAWFLCLSFDMLISISNPFSTFKDRVKNYHFFAWSFSFIMGAILASHDSMSGFYYANEDMDDTAICWIKSDAGAGGVNVLPSVFLYVPLFGAFCVSVGVLCLSYYWLRQGVSKTFQHRVKAFLANLTNLLVYTGYWTVNIVLFGVVYLNLEPKNHGTSRPAWKLLLFFIAAKGFANLIVWILVSDNMFFKKVTEGGSGTRMSTASEMSNPADGFDFNVVLRQEVLHYVTTGIKSSTERSTLCKETVRKIVFRMTKRATDRTQRFNTSYLLQLLFNPGALPEKSVSGVENKIRKSSNHRLSHTRGVETTNVSRVSSPLGSGGDDFSGVMSPVHDMTQTSVRSDSDGSRSEHCSSSMSVGSHPRGSGLSFTGITDARASFTEYDVSVVDGSPVDDLLLQNSAGARFQGLISNLLRPKAASSKEDLATLEEGVSEDGDSVDNRKGDRLDVEEVGGEGTTSHNSLFRFFSERFPWMGGGAGAHTRERETITPQAKKLPPEKNTAAVDFTGYDPYQFHRIRRASGVSEREFIDAFSETVKERLQDGGASGAFFFFSKGERFMAKSCTEEELTNIRVNIHTYADYFEKNPMSCIARIYGAFQLRIYSTSFYFYVMHNIFLTLDHEIVNEKYDIKGSWVNRNAAVPREGQVVTCSNCNQKFKYDPAQKAIKKANKLAMKKGKSNQALAAAAQQGSTPSHSADDPSRGTLYNLGVMNWFKGTDDDEVNDEDGRSKRCLLTVTGKHEPNVVLKDNDLKHKLKIPTEVASQLLHQLKKDAELLCEEISVMDYSLLVGVHNTVYEVDDPRRDTIVCQAGDASSTDGDGSASSQRPGTFSGDSGGTGGTGRGSLSAKPAPPTVDPASRFPVRMKCVPYQSHVSIFFPWFKLKNCLLCYAVILTYITYNI